MFLHVREDVVQLGPRADVAQEHVVDLWIEILLGDGVILLQTRTIGYFLYKYVASLGSIMIY